MSLEGNALTLWTWLKGFCGSFFLFRTVDSLCEAGLFTSLCENEICSQVRLQPKPVSDEAAPRCYKRQSYIGPQADSESEGRQRLNCRAWKDARVEIWVLRVAENGE